MSHNPRNILVTGGAGFIGSHFVRYLLEHTDAEKVINLDALTYAGSLANLDNHQHNLKHHFIKGDICDGGAVQAIMEEYNIDTIVHFAAESHVDNSIKDPKSFVMSNVVGTYTLLEAARQYWLSDSTEGTFRFHHISTDEVYGSLENNEPAFTEKSPYHPNSPYAATKAGSDHLVRAYAHTYNLPVTLSNCSNNYGPYQHHEKFIPTIINSCLHQKKIPLYGDGLQIRDWLHVFDHCRAIHRIIQRGVVGETYNVGGDNEVTNKDLCMMITRIFDELFPISNFSYTSLIHSVTDRPGHDRRYAINAEKMKSLLNWRPEISFKKGLKETIQSYCSVHQKESILGEAIHE